MKKICSFAVITLLVCSFLVHHHASVQASTTTKAAEVDVDGNLVVKDEIVDVDASSNEINIEGGSISLSFADALFQGKANSNGDWTKTSAAILEDTTAAFSNLAKNILSTINLARGTATDDDQDSGEDAASKNKKGITSLNDILSMAHDMAEAASANTPQRSIPQLMEHFKTHLEQSKAMVSEAFAHVDFTKLTLASLWYYVEHTESKKTPSWKRRMHRFHKPVEDINTILELHDALYLMQVAYLPKKEQIETVIETKFRNGTYEVVYAMTTGHPTEPAHFIMIPKVEDAIVKDVKKESTDDEDNSSKPSKERSPSSVLEVVIAIRGSGDIGDFISDSMMNATSYRSGKAHDGLAKSGQYIVNLHIDALRQLWKESGRERVKVILVGFSLGAGVAAIAAIELNEYDFIGELQQV